MDAKEKKAVDNAREEGRLEGMAHAFNIILGLLDGKDTSGVAGVVDERFQRIRKRIQQLLDEQ